jgi:uncharacterized membrane protein YfcA
MARALHNRSSMLLLAGLLALVVGLSLGMLGGGGSILTLPMLVYVLHVDAKSSIPGSLFVVAVTSAVGAVIHARAGNVKGRVGVLFGGAGMAGAFAGSRVGHLLPATALLVAFAAVMIATSLAMMRGKRTATCGTTVQTSKAIVIGVAVGFVSGLVGAGGGFLVVPALALFGGLDMPRAIGTSLLVIAMQSASGVVGHVAAGTPIPWVLVLVVTGASVVGSVAGARLVKHLSPETLRRGFGWFVLAMATFIVAKEIALVAAALVGLAGAAAGIVLQKVARNATARRAEEI